MGQGEGREWWLIGYRAYCGMPAGMEAFRVADRVLGEMEAKGEFKRS